MASFFELRSAVSASASTWIVRFGAPDCIRKESLQFGCIGVDDKNAEAADAQEVVRGQLAPHHQKGEKAFPLPVYLVFVPFPRYLQDGI